MPATGTLATAEPGACDLAIDDVFPADGATDVFIALPFDVPDLGLPGLQLRDTTLSLLATDGDGCSEVLSTFTSGPWGSFDEGAVYDGTGVRLSIGNRTGAPGESLFFPVQDPAPLFTRVDMQWASVMVGEGGGQPECAEPTRSPNGRVTNGTLSVSNLDGPAVDYSGVQMRWVSASFTALVDESSGGWDRVRARGHLDLQDVGTGLCTPTECVPCPDTGDRTCIALESLDLVGEPLPFVYAPADCPD